MLDYENIAELIKLYKLPLLVKNLK